MTMKNIVKVADYFEDYIKWHRADFENKKNNLNRIFKNQLTKENIFGAYLIGLGFNVWSAVIIDICKVEDIKCEDIEQLTPKFQNLYKAVRKELSNRFNN